MEEEKELEFEFTFNRSIKVESREGRLTGNPRVGYSVNWMIDSSLPPVWENSVHITSLKTAA